MAIATFAAGCFWGVQLRFDRLPGVIKTRVGYTGGHTSNPTYSQVCYGDTGHAEGVEIEFDPNVISYEQLLNAFWNMHDPTTPNRQGPDVGTQYRSAIFFHDEQQKQLALTSRDELEQNKVYPAPISTEIAAVGLFYEAEAYHQKYLERTGSNHC